MGIDRAKRITASNYKINNLVTKRKMNLMKTKNKNHKSNKKKKGGKRK